MIIEETHVLPEEAGARGGGVASAVLLHSGVLVVAGQVPGADLRHQVVVVSTIVSDLLFLGGVSNSPALTQEWFVLKGKIPKHI